MVFFGFFKFFISIIYGFFGKSYVFYFIIEMFKIDFFKVYYVD